MNDKQGKRDECDELGGGGVSAFPLPTGWAMASIADVIREVLTTDPATEPSVEITYFDISSIDNEAGRVSDAKTVLGVDAPSRARQVVQAGDVLFSTVRPNLRAIALVPEVTNGIASTGFCVLRAAQSMDPHYLYFYARSEGFLDVLLPLARGVSYPAVRSGDVVSQSIPIAPAAEQTRIVEKLEELLSDLDAGVTELKAAQKKLAQYRQSLLKAAVEGALTADWRTARSLANAGPAHAPSSPPIEAETGAQLLARILTERRSRWETRQIAKFQAQGKTPAKDWQAKYPEAVAPDTAGLPALPQGWVWASIDQLSPDDLANGRSVLTAESGAKVLRLTAVKHGRIDLGEYKIGAWSVDEAKPFAVVQGDLLIVRGNGSLTLVGRAGMVPEVTEQVAYPDTMIRLRVVESVVRPEWVGLLWDASITRSHLEKRARTSAGIYKISQPDIISVVIPVPPLNEQDLMLSMFKQTSEEMQVVQAMMERSLKQSAAQRKNILQAAFSGQLVPQDPADEPASALLARIRAERAARAAGGGRGRGKKKESA